MMQARPYNNLTNVNFTKKEVFIKVAFGPVESILRGQLTCLNFFFNIFESKYLDLFVGTRESFMNCPSMLVFSSAAGSSRWLFIVKRELFPARVVSMCTPIRVFSGDAFQNFRVMGIGFLWLSNKRTTLPR